MRAFQSVKIVEKNAGFSNSLVLVYEHDGLLHGIVVAWNVDNSVGDTIDLRGLVPENATNVQFGIIPNGAKLNNLTDDIRDIASNGADATRFTIEGSAAHRSFTTEDGTAHAIRGVRADLLLQSEHLNPVRPEERSFGDADDYALGDETLGDGIEVAPAPAPGRERDLIADPLASYQIGFEDLVGNTDGDFNDLIIEVTPVSDTPPVAITTAFAALEDSPVNGQLDAVDAEQESTALTFAIVSDPAKGSVTVAEDGTFTFDPEGAFESLGANDSETVDFTYRVTDGDGLTDTETVTVTVRGANDAPEAADDGGAGFTTSQDAPFTTASVLANDTDPDASDTLAVIGIDTTGTRGTVTDNGDGSFDYDPNGQFEDLAGGEMATDTFAYTISDGHGGTDTATVTIAVHAMAGGQPPIVDAVLAEDTGTEGDRATSNPALTGAVSSTASVTALFLSVNGGDPVDVSAALQSNGFAVGTDLLELANGGPLEDGELTFSLFAEDAAGRQSAAKEIAITLDRVAPELSDLGLAASSDTGLRGDAITALRSVRITGHGEPGAKVAAAGVETIVGVNGNFALNGVAIGEGANEVRLTTTDRAGNSSESIFEITGITGVEGQPVLAWNEIALEAIAGNAETPLGASRVLAMQSVAVYDVIAALDNAPAFLIDETAAEGADLAAAVAQASYVVLSYAFPAFQKELDAYLAEALGGVPDGDAQDAGVALGRAVAERLIEIRDTDGWNDFATLPGSDVPGEWRETGPLFETAISPQWANLDPWALDRQDQFRPAAPPALTSAEYADAVNEVRSLGAANSTTRTADQTEAARFWKDGRGTETTPGHWNSIATDLMKSTNTGSGDAARALAILNVSVADAMIAAWDTKYTYTLWRPENAIRKADTDGNPATDPYPGWQPLMLAPAHPEYVSGHASASGAAAEVLTSLFGPQSFTSESLGLAGVERSFDSFWEAAEENADSRLWAGVHFSFSNEAGLDQGSEVAQWALNAFNSQTDMGAPIVIVDVSHGYTNHLPYAVDGVALDTLSGVKALTVSIDDGDAATAPEVRNVSLGDSGTFSVALDDQTPDGTYTLSFEATDAAGNASKSVRATVVVDTADPALSLTSLTDGALHGTAARLTGTIDGTGSPIIALAYQIDGGRTYSLAYDQKTGAFDSALNLATLDAGSHTVTVIAADAAGNAFRQDVALTLDEAVPFVVTQISPANRSDEVGSTFRPEVHFSRPVDAETLTQQTFFISDAAGKPLAANVKVSADGLKAWLFPAGPMPGATSIRITLKGDEIKAVDGTPLDGDGDGIDGGSLASTFRTVSTTAVAGTTLSGFVVDPGNDLKPMTVDDYSAGPDGIDYTADDVFRNPIVGAKVFILGRESEYVTTDANGHFELTHVPSGNVKVAVDGRTATNAPEGVFWPEMVMDTTIIAGQPNTVMASMGTAEQRLAVVGRGEVYLPRVPVESLQAVSDTEATEIGMTVSAAQDLTTEQREAVKLIVQPGTVVDEQGNPVDNPMVGISTVPPELVMDMLPPGLMQHTYDLTIQAPGAAVFTTPAQLTLPNVFEAAPGTKLNFLSFDHTTGRLVIEGTATVSADGKTVTSDPDTGITKPGWHGLTPPGNPECLDIGDPTPNPNDPNNPPHNPPDNPPDNDWDEIGFTLSAGATLLGGAALLVSSPWIAAGLSAAALGASAYSAYRDYAAGNGAPGALGGAGLVTGTAGAISDGAVALDASGLVDAKGISKFGTGLGVLGWGLGWFDMASRILACTNASPTASIESFSTTPFFEPIALDTYSFRDGLSSSTLEGVVAFFESLTSDLRWTARAQTEAFHALIGSTLESYLPDGYDIGILDTQYAVVDDSENLRLLNRDTFEDFVDPSTNAVFSVPVAAIEAKLDYQDKDTADAFGAYALAAQTYGETLSALTILSKIDEQISDIVSSAVDGFMGTHGYHSPPPGDVYYLVTNMLTGDVIARGVTSDGALDVFLPPDTPVEFSLFDPIRMAFAKHGVYSGPSGSNEIQLFGNSVENGLTLFKFTGQEVDTDGDQLPDLAEKVIGTNPGNGDTDGDGLSDGFEVENNLDPLGGFPTTTGVVATLSLGSRVSEIAITPNVDGIDTLALVAGYDGTVSLVEIENRVNASLISQISVGNGASDIGVDGSLARAAVATGNAIQILEVANPAEPEIVASIDGAVSLLEVDNGRIFAADGATVIIYDLITGERIQTFSLASGATNVRAMSMEAGRLYVIDSSNQLSVLAFQNETLINLGQLSLAGQFWSSGVQTDKIFVSDDVLYIPANQGFNAGYATVDISDPSAMSILSGPDDRAISGTDFADAGNGIGIAVGRLGGAFGTDSVMVVDIDDPTATDQFVTRFDLDAAPTAVNVSAAFAYVGTEDGSFHIINFQPFDTNGVAPEVTLSASIVDADPGTDGVQLVEGNLLPLNAMISDDVGLQSVTLLVNGNPVEVDLSYPFDLRARIPLLAEGESSRPVSLQVRATDMGGNIGLSDLIEAEIVPDTIPPILILATVEEGATYGRTKRSFTFIFDEPLDPDIDLTAAFQLSGPSGTVAPQTAILRSGNQSVAFTFPELEQGSYVFTLAADAITDVAGNAFADEDRRIAFDVGTFSNEWTGAAGDGLWGTAASWSAGRVPDANDDVYVGDLTGEVTLQNLGEVQLSSIVAEAPLRLGYNVILATTFDAILDELTLTSSSSRFAPGTEATIGTLNLTNGAIGGDGTVNITERLDWFDGYFDRGGLLTIENGAVAAFGNEYDPEAPVPAARSIELFRDLLLQGYGTVGAANIGLGTRYYDSQTNQYIDAGGRFTIAPGAELELTNYNADFYRGSGIAGAGIENLGTLRKTGGGTSLVVSFGETLGNVVVEDGFISIGSGSTLRLTSQDDLNGLSGLRLDGGTLILDGDITIHDFQMASGRVEGDGDLTLTGSALWTGGTIAGAGELILPDDASLQLGQGYDPDLNQGTNSILLQRTLDVAGSVDHANAWIYLGNRHYDPQTPGYENVEAPINVLASGIYTFSSPFAAMLVQYPQYLSSSGLSNAGVVVKTGGGTSGAVFVGAQTGSFSFEDGILEITDGTFTLTQALIDAGFNKLLITGGIVTIEGDVTMAELTLRGGEISGDGSLTVSGLSWDGGTLALDGGITIPDGGTATVGEAYASATRVLAGTMTVEGTAVFNQGGTYLGRYEAGDTGSTPVSGSIVLTDTGTADFHDTASLHDAINNGATLSGLSGTGTLRKTDGGTANLLVQDFIGTTEILSGNFSFNSGYSTITAAMVAGGLKDLIVNAGVVSIDDDVSLDTLNLTGGRLKGSGAITITDSFVWTGGELFGDGTLTVDQGAGAHFGYPIEVSASTRALHLGKYISIDGEAIFGNANLYLGDQIYDPSEGGSVTAPGGLTIEAGGTLDFRNTAGGIFAASASYFADADPIGLINRGAISATYGETTTHVAFAGNEGTINADEGRLQIDGGVFEISEATNTDIFKIAAVAGGRLYIADDVTIAHLEFLNGTLGGPGDLTLSEHLNWRSGTFAGDGRVIIGAAAAAQLGYGSESAATTSLYLQQDLVVQGAAVLASGYLRLGTAVYDAFQGSYVNNPGRLIVDPLGSLRLDGEESDLGIHSVTGTRADSGNALVNNGTVVKTGGGTSSVLDGIQITGTGAFLTDDGYLEIGGGTSLTLSVGASLTAIRVNGGTLNVLDDAEVADLILINGEVTGPGDLTVTGHFWHDGGSLTGDGTLIIGSGATALFGRDYAGDTYYTDRTVTMARDVTIEGYAVVEQATLRMGVNAIPREGVTLTVADGGTLTFEGPVSSLRDFYSSDGSPNTLVNNGSIIKDGDGISEIDDGIAYAGSGAITSISGQITTPAGDVGTFTPPADTPVYADVVAGGEVRTLVAADGVSQITINGGILQVTDDVTLTDLSMFNGRIEGAGRITVTGHFDWEGGTLADGGDIVIAQGAKLVIGERTNVESAVHHGSLSLGRTLTVEGDALLEQAELALGAYAAGANSNGILNVTQDGHFEARGFNADIRRYVDAADGSRSAIILDGTFTKTGGGETRLYNLPVTGAGTVRVDDGSLDLQGGTTTLTTAGSALNGDVQVSGGRLTINEATDLTGLTSLALTGGAVLEVSGDVSITSLSLINSTLINTGTLTVTGEFFGATAIVGGGGELIVDEGASAEIGSTTGAAQSFDLGQKLTVNGDLNIESGQVRLGSRFYDSTLGQYVTNGGVIEVAASGTLTLSGANADIYNSYTEEGLQNGIAVDGALIKTGGGQSDVHNLQFGDSASVSLEDGTLALRGGTLVLTQALVDAGLTQIDIQGGELQVAEDVIIAAVTMTSGRISGAGDLTLSERAAFNGGSLRGDGAVIIGNDATAELGSYYGELGRDLQVDGALTITNPTYLGSAVYDSDQGQYVYSGGRIDVSDTGTLRVTEQGAIYVSTTPPQGEVWGIESSGAIVSTVENLQIPLIDGAFGTLQLNGGTLVHTSGELVLTQALVDAGLTALRMQGGTLTIDEDVALPRLELRGGTLTGSGNLTIGQDFEWTNGSMGGTGTTSLAATADVQFGLDYQETSSGGSGALSRTLEIQGNADFGNMSLSLGSAIYNTETSRYEHVSGALRIADGATLTMGGPSAQIYRNNPTAEDDTSGVFNAGSIVKAGGGISALPLQSNTGTFDFQDGALTLRDSEVALTQALIDAGFSQVVVQNGTLAVAEPLTIETLTVTGGVLVANAGLTVTGRFDWQGGRVETGTATLTVADTAEATFGHAFDPESPYSGVSLQFIGDMDIAGSVFLGQAHVSLGAVRYNAATFRLENMPGTIDVLESGRLDMNGPRSDFVLATSGFYASDNDAIAGVSVQGDIVKTGGGTSELPLYGENTGTFEQTAGMFSLSSARTDGLTTPVELTSGMVANGLDKVSFEHGILNVTEDVSLDSLDISEKGALVGPGNVTVTESFAIDHGVLSGTGDLILALGSNAIFGRETVPDQSNAAEQIVIAKDVHILGDARIERADLVLGGEVEAGDLDGAVADGDEDGQIDGLDGPHSGVLEIAASGRLDFFGPLTDITRRSNPVEDAVSGIRNAGTITKAGIGTTTIEDSLVFENDGMITLLFGAFDAPGTEYDYGL